MSVWAHFWAQVLKGHLVFSQKRNAEPYLLATGAYLKFSFYSKASRDADAAVRLNPNLHGAYTVGGTNETYLRDRKGAVLSFEKMLKANPSDAQTHLELGSIPLY